MFIDCKAHRKASHLEIKALHFEKHDFDEGLVITAFVKAITQFSQFQNCESITLTNANPKRLTQSLKRALKHLA